MLLISGEGLPRGEPRSFPAAAAAAPAPVRHPANPPPPPHFGRRRGPRRTCAGPGRAGPGDCAIAAPPPHPASTTMATIATLATAALVLDRKRGN